MFDIVSYEEAKSVGEAITLLEANPKARLIAGGTDLLIKIREGRMPDAELISIRGAEELKGISLEKDGTIRIGACTSFSAITAHPIIRQHVPVLAEAADTVGGPQIRHMATIGGNICNGATSADSAATLLALSALLLIEGAAGARLLPIRHFYKGPGRVDLQHGEVLTAILLTPDDYQGYGGQYIKYSMRNAMDIATLGCAVVCKISDHNTIEDFRLAFGVAAPTPVRCPVTEQLVIGQTFNETLLEAMGRSAMSEVSPRTSWRATKEFRTHLVDELSRRAFRAAFARAGGVLV